MKNTIKNLTLFTAGLVVGAVVRELGQKQSYSSQDSKSINSLLVDGKTAMFMKQTSDGISVTKLFRN